MECKKCKENIPDKSLYCMYCGAAQKRDKKKKMYQRPDGLFEQILVIDGKRKAFRAKSEQEVIRKIADYDKSKQDGLLFKTVADKWSSEHFENLSPNSLKNYNPALKRAIKKFGNCYVNEIQPQDIKNYIKGFELQGNKKKTVKTQISIISMILTYAATQGYIQFNPAEYIKCSNSLPQSKRREPPNESEVKIMNESINCTFGLFAYLVMYTGCRRGEALALQYKDIDKEKKIISITKSVYYENNYPKIKAPKTQSSVRNIPLFDFLAEKIPVGNPDNYIFSDENGELLKQHRFDKLWKEYCKETGLKLTPHQLRHGYATLLFENGISEKDAQELLGHSTLAMTQDVYTHIRKMQRAKTFAKLNLIQVKN